MKELGYTMDMDFFISTLGVPNRACRELYTELYGDDFPYEDVCRRLFDTVRSHARKHGTPLKSGAEACLRELKARGLKLVLATSCPRFVVDDFFRALPALDQLLDGKICGDEVTNGKPDPEIFIKAARLAGQAPRRMPGRGGFPERAAGHPRVGCVFGDDSGPAPLFRSARALHGRRAQ